MTSLERLALAVSARLSGDDLVLVLDYVEALKRQMRVEALEDAFNEVVAAEGDGGYSMAIRGMIERERGDV